MKENNQQEEIWLDIPNFDGMYQVSNFGRVKSLERIVEKKDGKICKLKSKIIKPYIMKKGLKQKVVKVTLSKDCFPKNFHVSRLVAICFLKKDLCDDDFVIHIDLNCANNHILNLEVVGRDTFYDEFKKLSNNQVDDIVKLRNNGLSLGKIAKIYNVGNACIFNIVHNKTYKKD